MNKGLYVRLPEDQSVNNRLLKSSILSISLLAVLFNAQQFRACAAAGSVSKARAAETAPAATGASFFRDGDVPIVLLGDSITEQREYTTFIECYVLTHHPNWRVKFRNLGWSGDTMSFQRRVNFDTGLKRDILPLHPVSMTIDFGMNDARAGEQGLDRYVEHARKLASELKKINCRFAFISSSPEEKYEDAPGGSHYNLMLEKYTDALRAVAEQEGVPFVDQLHPFIKAIESGRQAGVLGKDGAPRLVPDAVHPNWAGQLVMADIILKGLGADPLVSEVVLDAKRKSVVSTRKCTVKTEKTEGNEILRFSRLDEALPMPIPEDARVTLDIPSLSVLSDLSGYTLRITNLPPGDYHINIDGVKAASHSADQLEKGVNLTMECGPIKTQALELFKSVIQKNDLFFDRWRKVQLFEVPKWLDDANAEASRQAELRRLDSEIEKMEKQIDDLRRPKPHQFAIVPQ